MKRELVLAETKRGQRWHVVELIAGTLTREYALCGARVWRPLRRLDGDGLVAWGDHWRPSAVLADYGEVCSHCAGLAS